MSRTEKDGTIVTLADQYQGKRLNSPNDVICKSSGDLYFTDPNTVARRNPPDPHGDFKQDLDFNGVYRITAAGKLDLLTREMTYPNGIAFSPDEKKLYIANSRPKFWMVYDVNPDGALANGRKFFDMSNDTGEAVPDGMKIDHLGNIFATGPGGVLILSPQGKHLGTIELPEIPANCGWGGTDGKTLYITARTSLYRVKLAVAGKQP